MRRYLIFASAGLSLLMHAMDVTMVAVAFPDLMKDFSTNVLWAGWTVSIYLIAVTSVMPLMGTLSDNLGRKKIFLSLSAFLQPVPSPVGLHPMFMLWWPFGFCKASEERVFSQRRQGSSVINFRSIGRGPSAFWRASFK